jgi:hypothetical protein
MKGCVMAMDGWVCKTRCPSKTEDVSEIKYVSEIGREFGDWYVLLDVITIVNLLCFLQTFQAQQMIRWHGN